MSHATPEPERGPSGELPTKSSNEEMSLEFFPLWMEIMKIENVVLYYSGGLSSRKFGDWKRKVVVIFEKAQVLEQYWVLVTELHLQGEDLSYWEDEKAMLESDVQWEEFIRIIKDFE